MNKIIFNNQNRIGDKDFKNEVLKGFIFREQNIHELNDFKLENDEKGHLVVNDINGFELIKIKYTIGYVVIDPTKVKSLLPEKVVDEMHRRLTSIIRKVVQQLTTS